VQPKVGDGPRSYEARRVHRRDCPPIAMTRRLTYDELRALLPGDVPELSPILEEALRTSTPDADATWSSAGELATVGTRLIDSRDLSRRAADVLSNLHAHLAAVYEHVALGVEAAEDEDPQRAARALLEAAALEERYGRYAAAAGFAGAAYRVLDGAQEGALPALALRRRARAVRAQGRLDEALVDYARAAEMARAADDTEGCAEALIGSGNIHEQRGHWGAAEASFREALDLLEGISPLTPAHWHAPLNLHIVLRSRGDLETSRAWLDRARDAASKLPDRSSLQFLANAEGQLSMAEGDASAAERHFEKALEGASGPNAAVTIGLNLAECLLSQGRRLDAAERTREAEREAILGNAGTKLPEVYRMLGRIAAVDRNPDAFVLFERSLEFASGSETIDLERARTFQAYGEAERASGRPESADALEQRAFELYRTLGVPGIRRRWVDCYDVPLPDHSRSDLSTTEDRSS